MPCVHDKLMAAIGRPALHAQYGQPATYVVPGWNGGEDLRIVCRAQLGPEESAEVADEHGRRYEIERDAVFSFGISDAVNAVVPDAMVLHRVEIGADASASPPIAPEVWTVHRVKHKSGSMVVLRLRKASRIDRTRANAVGRA